MNRDSPMITRGSRVKITQYRGLHLASGHLAIVVSPVNRLHRDPFDFEQSYYEVVFDDGNGLWVDRNSCEFVHQCEKEELLTHCSPIVRHIATPPFWDT